MMKKKKMKVKKKKSFPDVSGDGKITKKDILMARGVIPKTKNGIEKNNPMKAKTCLNFLGIILSIWAILTKFASLRF